MRSLLRDLSPGTQYALQLRSVTADGVSDWSRIFYIETTTDSVAPKTPTNVSVQVSGSSFVCSWDEVTLSVDDSPATDLAYYLVKITSPSSSIVGIYKTVNNKFEFTYDNNVATFLDAQATVSIFVAAADAVGNVSDYSTPIAASNPPPADVVGLSVRSSVDSIESSWQPNTDPDLAGYQLHVGTTSNFTPNSSTLKWIGSATAATYATTLYATDLYVKVYAYDIFKTTSVNPATAGPVRPKNSVTVDNTPPPPPTNLNASIQTDPKTALATLNIAWNASPDTDNDLAGYVVNYRQENGIDWSSNFIGPDQTNTAVRANPYVNYEVRVAAFDTSANYSGWTPIATAFGGVDTAPSKPAAPTVAASTQRIQVNHSGKKVDGTNLEADVDYLEVYADVNSGFAPQQSNMLGTIKVGLVTIGTFFVPAKSSSDIVENWWVKVIAVDRGGNKSIASDSSVSVPVELIGSLSITEIEADQIKANSAFLSDLSVLSKFTLGDSTRDGAIESYDYNSSGGAQGFRLAKSGLIIKSGLIESSAIKIQQGANLLPPQYADFEFHPNFYVNGGLKVEGAGTGEASSLFSKRGSQSARIIGGIGQTSLVLEPVGTTYNIPVETGTTYIYSVWIYNGQLSGSCNPSLSVKFKESGDLVVVSSPAAIAPNLWTRVYGTFTVPEGNTAVSLYVTFETFIGSCYVDACQLEAKIGALNTPSVWRPPSYTSIDGGIIRTGEIRSSANITVNGSTQPSWSINTQGNIQIGDALVRGRLLIGTSTDIDNGNSYVSSGNFLAGNTGWRIKSDGNVEFNSGYFRGSLGANTVGAGSIQAGAVRTENLALGVINSNPVPDPSFEEDYAFGSKGLLGWRQWSVGGTSTVGPEAARRKSSFSAHSGVGWAEIYVANQGSYRSIQSGGFDLTPGDSVRVQFFAASLDRDSLVTANLVTGPNDDELNTVNNISLETILVPQAQVVNEDGTILQLSTLNAQGRMSSELYYKFLSGAFVVPAGHTRAAIRIRNAIYGTSPRAGSSTLLVDDVSCIKIGYGTAEVTSAGIRLFDKDGEESAALVSNRPNYLTIVNGGVPVASIDETGGGVFRTLAITGNTDVSGNVDSGLQIFGQEWLDIIDEYPKGIIASSINSNLVIDHIGTEWYGLGEVSWINEFDRAGLPRNYRFDFAGIHVSSNTNNTMVRLKIKYTNDGSSPLSSGGTGYNTAHAYVRVTTAGQQEFSGPMWTYGTFSTVKGALIRAVVFIKYAGTDPAVSVTANTNLGSDYQQPLRYLVTDIGRDKPDTYIANSGGGRLNGGQTGSNPDDPPGPTHTYTKTYTANWTSTFRSDGSRRTDTTDAVQGYYPTNGNQRALIGFPSILSDVGSGKITKIEVYLYANHWWYGGGGTAIIGLHRSTSTATSMSGPTYGIFTVGGWKNGEGKWVTLPSSLYSAFLGSSPYRGITLGPGSSTSGTYYGRFDGSSGTRKPVLRVTYVK